MAKAQKTARRKSRKKTETNAKRLGRPPQLDIQDLEQRFRDMRQFLENYWGRVGLGLRAARNPEDVTAVLSLVPHIESWRSFRGHAICLIEPTATRVGDNELRETRRRSNDAHAREQRLWSESNTARQNAEQAVVAVRAAFAGFQTAFTISPFFFFVIYVLARALRVEELVTLSQGLEADYRRARIEKDALHNSLRSQEAWFARNEVVKFARNRRHDKTLLNFARAMAGLPEWGWFHSRRICEGIQDQSTPATPYLLFQLILAITRKTKPVTMTNVEKKLRIELLQPNLDLFLKSYATSHWYYLQEALSFCRGKEFKRRELPFKIMDRFLHNLERPKTIAEIELAKVNQLS
jgi:translation initiation factor IF-3